MQQGADASSPEQQASKRLSAVAITSTDLERMLAAAPVMGAEERIAARKQAEAEREAGRTAAKARKERMLRLEEEAQRLVGGVKGRGSLMVLTVLAG